MCHAHLKQVGQKLNNFSPRLYSPDVLVELAMIMDRLYGGVCYAGIDTDPELKYPKGAGRVAFSNQQSYIAAISARFVQLQHGDIDKRVEVKPYVLDDQMCDECQGQRCGGKFAPFFCANVTCLQVNRIRPTPSPALLINNRFFSSTIANIVGQQFIRDPVESSTNR